MYSVSYVYVPSNNNASPLLTLYFVPLSFKCCPSVNAIDKKHPTALIGWFKSYLAGSLGVVGCKMPLLAGIFRKVDTRYELLTSLGILSFHIVFSDCG